MAPQAGFEPATLVKLEIHLHDAETLMEKIERIEAWQSSNCKESALMRRRLAGASTRIRRLAEQQRELASDSLPDVDRMAPEQREWEMVQIAERFAGPMASFDTVDDFLEALSTEFAKYGKECGDVANVVRRHWSRLHWFEDHEAHGAPVLVRIDPEAWRATAGSVGLRMVFQCPCNGSEPALATSPGLLSTWEAFVPGRFRSLPPSS